MNWWSGNVIGNGINRRRMLGRLLAGAGAALTSLSLTSLGRAATRKSRFLLESTTAARGLETVLQFTLLEALHGRRARRFSLGASIPDGPLAYTSQHAPMPLSDLEQMLVLTAVAGNTGWLYLHPFNKRYLPNIPNYAGAAGGRTFPSSAGFHTSEIFFTDDTGIYFLPTRDLQPTKEYTGSDTTDLEAYFQVHRARIRKLSDKRMHIPENPAHIDMHNPWCVNRPGSTLIIPVADLAQHHIAALCYLVQNGACIFDDINHTPIPELQKFSALVDTRNPYPLTFLEQLVLTEATVETGTACYAGALMLQAIGLGGWMFDGITPFSVLGASGDPEVPGLGFRFDTDSRWSLPNATGLPGVFEGFCPPHFKDMRAAVEALVKRKFGPGGPFNPATEGPYRENARVRAAGKIHDSDFIDCVATMAQYVYDRFGKFPGMIPTIHVLMYLQAHHLDLGFYDTHFQPGAYLDTHRDHMATWHA
ncbi:MAG: hypothetical protein AB1772_09995 [Candidatus Zixiibacteriota bacterium]